MSNGCLIVRPTDDQYKKFKKVMSSGRYKTKSEALRYILNIGLEIVEKEVKRGKK